jgi:hypothetical protein
MNGHFNSPFEPQPPDLNEELDLEEKLFPNGRRIQAVHQHVIQVADSTGLKTYKVEKRATLDDGCTCRLCDSYFCFNPKCQKVVCYRHATGPCSLCQRPSFCNACIVAVTLEQGSANVKLLCKSCFNELASGFFVRTLRRLWRWLRR